MKILENELILHINKKVELTAHEASLVLSVFEKKQIRKRSVLVQFREVSKYVYFISKGCIRSYYSDDKGVDHIFQIGLEGNWIGDLESFLTCLPGKYNIQALEECEVYQISLVRLDELYNQIPKLERFFRLLFQTAYVTALNRLNTTMWDSASVRYNELLKNQPNLLQRVPLVYIASLLGITPESLSRIRKQNLQ